MEAAMTGIDNNRPRDSTWQIREDGVKDSNFGFTRKVIHRCTHSFN